MSSVSKNLSVWVEKGPKRLILSSLEFGGSFTLFLFILNVYP